VRKREKEGERQRGGGKQGSRETEIHAERDKRQRETDRQREWFGGGKE